MRDRTGLAFSLLLVPLLAGCLADDGSRGPRETDLPQTTASYAQTLNEGVPSFDLDMEAAVDWWEHIATQYPKHDSWTPSNDLLRDHLVAELQGLGLDVDVRRYQALPRDVADPSVAYEGELTEVNAVIGIKKGTWAQEHPDAPDHRIGVVAHYDTQTGTVHGAYDDKSGVAAQFHVCKSLAAVSLNHTLACIFFDAEEQGLVASARYVEDIKDEADQYVYDFVIGYDMTGINWPGHAWNLYLMTGPADDVPHLQAFGQDLLHGVLGYPDATQPSVDSGVVVLDTHDRNSDERRFKEAGVPIYRFAGGRNAADYPQYHMPLDTVEYVYDYVGGRPNFVAGFTAIVESSHHLVLGLDATSNDALRAHYT